MLYTKEIREKYTADVVIIGGGAAGVAAAIASARAGASVFLAEASGCFGGLGTSGMVPAFAPFDDGVNTVAAGIGFDIRQKVSKDIPLSSYWTPIRTEELKRVYDEEMVKAGVRFSFFTTCVDAVVRDGRMESVVLYGKSGLFSVSGKVFIDCTGDGDLCAQGDGRFEKGDENGNVMPGTLCSLWAGVAPERIDLPQNCRIEEAFKDGVLSVEDRHLPGIFYHKDGMGGGNIGHLFNLDPLDEASLTAGMLHGRRSLVEYERYYKEYLHGYEDMQLYATAPMPGVRESRRILCDYMLNARDFLTRAVFSDEIGRYCYPVDIHVMNTDKNEYERFSKEYATMRYKDGESYGIPYRSLVPVSFSNVLVAGRCMGCDRQMQASIRVMPGCFITGQAAGSAAALAARKTGDVRADVSQEALTKALLALGAYLPNA